MSAISINTVRKVDESNLSNTVALLTAAYPASTMIVGTMKGSKYVIVSSSDTTTSVRFFTRLARKFKSFKPNQITKIVDGKKLSALSW